jgi:hypothetical protein
MSCLSSFESKIGRHVQHLRVESPHGLCHSNGLDCLACSLTCSGSSRPSPFNKFSGTRPTAWQIKAVARQYQIQYCGMIQGTTRIVLETGVPKDMTASVLDHCSRRQGSSSSLRTSLLALQVKLFGWTCAGQAERIEGVVDGSRRRKVVPFRKG